MGDEIVRQGGCLCGAVRYAVEGEPYQSGLCHCTTCRKITGSAFSATANWKKSKFRTEGNTTTFEGRSFCPTCGSRLFFFLEDSVEVFLGTLNDAPSDIAPMVEVWTIRRESWLGPPMAPDTYDKSEVS